MYFRVEDEYGLSPNLREYGWNNLYNTLVHADNVDALIANEIRTQVNNCNERSVFSYSKSLGTVLFKYNSIGDNPIHLLPVYIPIYDNNWVEFDVIDNEGVKNILIPYYITDLNYPIKQHFGSKEIYLKNYTIDVNNDMQLDKYLRNYTKIGKKKLAACEKDSEVIIRHVVDDYVIAEYIDAVYLIYALQYETNFIDFDVVNDLIRMIEEEIENENECDAFKHLVYYLYRYWDYEKKISEKILQEKRQEPRTFGCYDGYSLALDIMNGDIKDALINCDHYPFDRMINNIWKIYIEWGYPLR